MQEVKITDILWDIQKLGHNATDLHMDGYYQFGQKKKLYQILWEVERQLKQCSIFYGEEEWLQEHQQDLMIELTHRVGAPWSEHMAYLMGATRADNELGRILMKLGRPLCSLVSYLPLRSKTAKAATTITVCALCVGNYYIARSVISLKKIKSYTFKELRNER